MIAVLLAAALARAEDTVTFDRLFGPEEALPAAQPAAAAPAPELPAWAWPVGLLAIGGALALRWKVTRAATTGVPIRIVSRQPLGDRSALVLVDVEDADGERRRLLIGTGPGAPSLVADLGLVAGADRAAEPAFEPAFEPVVPRNIADEILEERRNRDPYAGDRGQL